MAGRSRTAEVDRLRRVYDDYDRDPHARRRWSLDNPGNRAVHAERARRSAELLRGVPGPVLDLGCGTGQVLAELAPALDPSRVRLGVDLSASRLSEGARRRPEASFVRAEGSELPLPDEGVGLVLAYTLFSSVLDDGLARRVAAEIARVLRPGGVVAWYDLRRSNPANAGVRGWPAPAVVGLFPGWAVDLRPVTVLPPLARRLGRATDRAYPWLARVRPLTTHLLGRVTKPA